MVVFSSLLFSSLRIAKLRSSCDDTRADASADASADIDSDEEDEDGVDELAQHGWVAVPADGGTYYHHAGRNETTWTHPLTGESTYSAEQAESKRDTRIRWRDCRDPAARIREAREQTAATENDRDADDNDAGTREPGNEGSRPRSASKPGYSDDDGDSAQRSSARALSATPNHDDDNANDKGEGGSGSDSDHDDDDFADDGDDHHHHHDDDNDDNDDDDDDGTVDEESAVDTKTEYEQAREKKIAANQRQLRALGFTGADVNGPVRGRGRGTQRGRSTAHGPVHRSVRARSGKLPLPLRPPPPSSPPPPPPPLLPPLPLLSDADVPLSTPILALPLSVLPLAGLRPQLP